MLQKGLGGTCTNNARDVRLMLVLMWLGSRYAVRTVMDIAHCQLVKWLHCFDVWQVFMGMGEPLHNLDAVVAACDIMCHPLGLHMSQNKVRHARLSNETSNVGPAYGRRAQLLPAACHMQKLPMLLVHTLQIPALSDAIPLWMRLIKPHAASHHSACCRSLCPPWVLWTKWRPS